MPLKDTLKRLIRHALTSKLILNSGITQSSSSNEVVSLRRGQMDWLRDVGFVKRTLVGNKCSVHGQRERLRSTHCSFRTAQSAKTQVDKFIKCCRTSVFEMRTIYTNYRLNFTFHIENSTEEQKQRLVCYFSSATVQWEYQLSPRQSLSLYA